MIKRKCSLFYVLSVFCDISLYTQHGIVVCFYMRCVVITTVVLLLCRVHLHDIVS